MTLKQLLSDSVKDAMRSKQKERLAALRLVMSAIKQIEVDERIELDDARVIAVLDKMAKQRRESISQFTSANRVDLADKEQFELDIINSFLPQPLTEQELTDIITQAITDSQATGIKDMGKVMALIKPKAQGRADMSAVSANVRRALS